VEAVRRAVGENVDILLEFHDASAQLWRSRPCAPWYRSIPDGAKSRSPPTTMNPGRRWLQRHPCGLGLATTQMRASVSLTSSSERLPM
jgi:hypothetical protein